MGLKNKTEDWLMRSIIKSFDPKCLCKLVYYESLQASALNFMATSIVLTLGYMSFTEKQIIMCTNVHS